MAPLLAKWGSSGWTFLHSVSFSYSERPTSQERRDMFVFLQSVGNVLPCKRCRAHYNSYVATHLRGSFSPALADRESLSRFVVDLHNDVNLRLQRPTVDYESVRHQYEVDADDGWLLPAIGIGVLSLAGVMVYRRAHRRPA